MKPRNLHVPAMMQRKQGPHGKSKKAMRRQEKMETQTLRGVSGLAHLTLNQRGHSSNLCGGTNSMHSWC